MIDPSLFTVENILRCFLDTRDKPWLDMVTIVPTHGVPPRCVVVYRQPHESDIFLRHSKGPKQGHFWDIYGDDYQTPELAFAALLDAPPPPSACSLAFRWGHK